jgi:hypothetical protein
VRLAVHEDGVAGVPIGVEVSAALGGVGQVDADVRNDEQAFVRRAFELEAQLGADAGSPTVGGDEPVGFELVRAFGGVDFQLGKAIALRHDIELVAPAQVDERVSCAGIEQVLFEILLLQVDHGEKAVVFAVRSFHAEHALAAIKRVSKAPGQTVLGDAVCHADLLQDFHRAAGEDNRTAAL